MKSFTEQLKSYEPEVYFGFKKNDISIQYDQNEPYWTTEDSILFNELSGDYFKAKMVRGNNKFFQYDPTNLSNQLTENEIYNENDYSLLIGRNNTDYNGLNFKYYRDEPFDEDYELQKELSLFFQLKISANDNKKKTKIIDYDLNDDYAVVFVDSNSPDHTQVFRTSYSHDEVTNTEVWGNSVSPVLYRAYFDAKASHGESIYSDINTDDQSTIEMNVLDGQNYDSKLTMSDEFGSNININMGESVDSSITLLDVGRSDKRIIKIILLNPRTGEHYDTYKFMFDRKSTLTEGTNYTLNQAYSSKNIYDLFDQQPTYGDVILDNTNKPTIDKIVIGTLNGKEMTLRKWLSGDDISIPVLNDVKVYVKNKRLQNRNFIIEDISTPEQYRFMQLHHFELYYNHNNRAIYVYRKSDNVLLLTIGMPLDTSYIFGIKMEYEYLSGHDPSSNNFNYNMKYTFKVNNTSYSTIVVNYKGSRFNFKDRGTGNEINSVPTFLNMPFVLGWLPKQSRDTRYGYQKYNVNIGEHICVCEYIKHFNYSVPTNIISIDNIAFFDSDYVYNDYYNLFYKSFNNSNRILDQNLINYWACDRLVDDLLTVENKFVYSNGYNESFDVYSNMKIRNILTKNGKPTHEKENHRAIKNSIKFENCIGNANIRNRSWSQSGNYTISFWFKSKQKTKGVILSDYENKVYNSNGVNFSIIDGGYLELRINDFNKRSYQNIGICDDKWHLIVLRVSSTSSSTNQNYTLFVDDNIIDRFDGRIGNKDYYDSYQIYFMGHPYGENVNGNLARVSFYNTTLSRQLISLMYEGDIEHNIQGTILMENMPISTEVRVYNNRTGELISKVQSNNDNGVFIYRNFNNFDVYIVVVDKTKMFGDIQTIGPIEPKSIE